MGDLFCNFNDNETVERLFFSLINAERTNEKNRSLRHSVKSIILIKYNFNHMTCEVFYKSLLQHKVFLLSNVMAMQNFKYPEIVFEMAYLN